MENEQCKAGSDDLCMERGAVLAARSSPGAHSSSQHCCCTVAACLGSGQFWEKTLEEVSSREPIQAAPPLTDPGKKIF